VVLAGVVVVFADKLPAGVWVALGMGCL